MTSSRYSNLRMRRPRAIARDRSGASAVEFSILAFPFIGILIAILELSVDYFYFSQIDYATHKAAEDVRTGSVIAAKMTAAEFKTQLICPRLSVVDCDAVLVSTAPITAMHDWGNRMWTPGAVNPGTARWCLGGAGEVVALQVAYPIPLLSRIWASAIAPSTGTAYYLSSSGFRNDAFGLARQSNASC